jgi:hypothetical protein
VCDVRGGGGWGLLWGGGLSRGWEWRRTNEVGLGNGGRGDGGGGRERR